MTTPGHVTVERSKQDMTVRCSKQGYQDVVGTMPSDIDDWTLVNFAFARSAGAAASMRATGAINDYDDTYKLHHEPGLRRARAATATADAYPDHERALPMRARRPIWIRVKTRIRIRDRIRRRLSRADAAI